MAILNRLKSLLDVGSTDEKIALWITHATGEAATRIYEGLSKGHLLEKHQIDDLFLPLSAEIASFHVATCVPVIMKERQLPGAENCRKIIAALFDEIRKRAECHTRRNDRRSAFFCTALLVDPATRPRTFAYCFNYEDQLAVSQGDINRYADKYRPAIKNLPPDQTSLACLLVRLSRVAQLDKIQFEAGQKLAEMLLTNSVLDDTKGVMPLQEAVADLLRKKR